MGSKSAGNLYLVQQIQSLLVQTLQAVDSLGQDPDIGARLADVLDQMERRYPAAPVSAVAAGSGPDSIEWPCRDRMLINEPGRDNEVRA